VQADGRRPPDMQMKVGGVLRDDELQEFINLDHD
jgi:hypothetical protein